MPESQHCAFSSSERKVRVFGPIVQPAAHLAAIEISQLTHRCRIGSQPVGDDCLSPAVPLQRFLQERQSCRFVALSSDVTLEAFAFVVDSPPQRSEEHTSELKSLMHSPKAAF